MIVLWAILTAAGLGVKIWNAILRRRLAKREKPGA